MKTKLTTPIQDDGESKILSIMNELYETLSPDEFAKALSEIESYIDSFIQNDA